MVDSRGSGSTKPTVVDDFYDYSSVVGFEKNYVAQFYGDRPVNNDEKLLIEFFVPRLRRWAATSEIRTSLEIGCGPTLHHAILVTPYVSSIFLADYLEGNRTAVRHWLEQSPEATDWSQYTRFILESEPSESGSDQILAREASTRLKVTDVISCNLMSPTVVETSDTYDLVGCFYCLEEVAGSAESFASMIQRVAAVVRPGGRLMIASLRSTSFYHVQGDDGKEVEFPCLSVTETLVVESLVNAGFEVEPGDVVSVDVEGQAEEGVPGIVLAFVRKRLDA